MDILYNTNFSSQLRSEQNISTISHYLKNIINKTDDRRKNEVYSIKKIVNVLNWMMQDWQIESIVKVIVNITANWTLDKSKSKGKLYKKNIYFILCIGRLNLVIGLKFFIISIFLYLLQSYIK